MVLTSTVMMSLTTYKDSKGGDKNSSSSSAFGVNNVKPAAKSTTVCKATMGGNVRLTMSRVGTTDKVGKGRVRCGFRSSRTSSRGSMGTCGALGS